MTLHSSILARATGGLAVAVLSLCVSAESLVWTGAASANWDASTKNWTNATGTAVAFANGSDVRIDDTRPGNTINVTASVAPRTAVFDFTGTLTLASGNAGGFAAATGSIEKRGTGTLLLDGSVNKNLNVCPVYIRGGTVKVNRPHNMYDSQSKWAFRREKIKKFIPEFMPLNAAAVL